MRRVSDDNKHLLLARSLTHAKVVWKVIPHIRDVWNSFEFFFCAVRKWSARKLKKSFVITEFFGGSLQGLKFKHCLDCRVLIRKSYNEAITAFIFSKKFTKKWLLLDLFLLFSRKSNFRNYWQRKFHSSQKRQLNRWNFLIQFRVMK